MHPLVFEVVKSALGRCVIPIIALATHRSGHAVFDEFVLKVATGVLVAPADYNCLSTKNGEVWVAHGYAFHFRTDACSRAAGSL